MKKIILFGMICVMLLSCSFLAEGALTDNLWGYWGLNEANSSTDLSGNGWNATSFSTRFNSSCISGNCQGFVTDTSNITWPFKGSNLNFSISTNLWIWASDIAQYSGLFGQHGAAQTGLAFNNLDQWVTYTSRGSHTESTNLQDSHWHMLTHTFNNNTLLCTSYIDGVNGTPWNCGAFGIGLTYNWSSPRDYYSAGRTYVGYMDEVGIWSRTLTPADVSELYNSGTGLAYPFVASDSTPPVVTLNQPVDAELNSTATLPVTYPFNCTMSDETATDSLQLFITNSANTSFSVNQTTASNNTLWSVALGEGNYTWNCLGNDTSNNLDWGVNRTLSVQDSRSEPVITYVSPADNDHDSTNLSVVFVAGDGDNDTLSCNLSVSGGIGNVSNTSVTAGTTTTLSTTTMSTDGSYTWMVSCSDHTFTINQTNRTYVLDTLTPNWDIGSFMTDNTTFWSPKLNGTMTLKDNATDANLFQASINITLLSNGTQYYYYNESTTDTDINLTQIVPINVTEWLDGTYLVEYEAWDDHTFGDLKGLTYSVNEDGITFEKDGDNIQKRVQMGLVDNGTFKILTAQQLLDLGIIVNVVTIEDYEYKYSVDFKKPEIDVNLGFGIPKEDVIPRDTSIGHFVWKEWYFDFTDMIGEGIELQYFDSGDYHVMYASTNSGTTALSAKSGDVIRWDPLVGGLNKGVENYTFVVDNTAPGVTIGSGSPIDNSWIANGTPVFQFTPFDNLTLNLSCELWINGTNYGRNTAIYNNTLTEITTNATLGDNHNYSWFINCSDKLGNTMNTTNRTFGVDTTTPAIEQQNVNATSGINPYYVIVNMTCVDSGSGNATASFMYQDASDAWVGNISMAFQQATGWWNYTLLLSPDGIYDNFTFFCNDSASLSISNTSSLLVLINSSSTGGSTGGSGSSALLAVAPTEKAKSFDVADEIKTTFWDFRFDPYETSVWTAVVATNQKVSSCAVTEGFACEVNGNLVTLTKDYTNATKLTQKDIGVLTISDATSGINDNVTISVRHVNFAYYIPFNNFGSGIPKVPYLTVVDNIGNFRGILIFPVGFVLVCVIGFWYVRRGKK